MASSCPGRSQSTRSQSVVQAAPHGIRVNAVSPGLIDTPGQRNMMETVMAAEDLPAMGNAESVARGVLYALCDAPKTMTGQSLDLFDDG